jgi:hypothetical protein
MGGLCAFLEELFMFERYNTEEWRPQQLLEKAYELLKRQDESSIVLNILEETVHYDEAYCDGYCLMEDIKECLGL